MTAAAVLARLTLDQKATLLSGADFWSTPSIEQGGEIVVPSMTLTDGPHGVRKQGDAADHLGLGTSVPATCFPTAAAMGSTWNRSLLREVGEALGREARENRVNVLLGPGTNIKRSPLCGRNFEYLSEDPTLSGELSVPLIEGIQSQGVGASLKHFAVNNQETDRMRVSADLDERTMRELYLPAFETAVRRAQPWTVMCSYNRINGVFASESHWLLTEVLRDEWEFEGLVVSDWGAVSNRVAALLAGLDLEMPDSDGRTDAEVVAAVRSGELDESVVDAAVLRVLELIERSAIEVAEDYDRDEHHALARRAAAEGAILLRNEQVDGAPALPLDPAASGLLVVGEFARSPRFQGAGSSQVVPTRVDDALTALSAAAYHSLSFAAGYRLDGTIDDVLVAEAVSAARRASRVILFLGLPDSDESEGFDRTSMDLPQAQLVLLHALADSGAPIVVVLANGSVVTMVPWRDRVAAILEGWLGGQAGGSAIADLLFGVSVPSGRLAESIPLRLEHNPSFGNFPGALGHVAYGEGVFVGYRYYDAKKLEVAYPFGFGLSYTSFEYDDAEVVPEGTGFRMTVRITNAGAVSGAEVVQFYVSDPQSVVARPPVELKGFAKVLLEPGQSTVVEFAVSRRDLSFWHQTLRSWVVESGEFVLSVGASSRDLRHSVTVTVAGDDLREPLTEWSTLEEALQHPQAAELLREASAESTGPTLTELERVAGGIPLRVIASFRGMLFDRDQLAELLTTASPHLKESSS